MSVEHSSLSSPILRSVQAFAATLISLWTIDVLVNLGLIDQIASGTPLSARPRDYLGLALADAAVALVVVLLGWIVATVFVSVSRRGNVSTELANVLAAAVSAAALLSGFRSGWTLGPGDILLAVTVSGGIGCIVWLGLRLTSKRLGSWPPGLAGFLTIVLLPALVLGMGNRALALALRQPSEWPAAGVNAILAILVIVSVGLVRQRLGPARIPFLAGFAVAAALALAALSVLPERQHEAPAAGKGLSETSPPDIVLIVLDTVRADHLRHYGYTRDTMPGLERWAKTAATFTRAVSPAGWTGPAHVSMFTGRRVSDHGFHYGVDIFRTRAFDDVVWLPRSLADRGYVCIGVTANHAAIPEEMQGFDRVVVPRRTAWVESTVGALADDFSPWFDRVSERLRWRMPYADAQQVADTVIRVTPATDRPLFLFVNFLDAHSPYNPPSEMLQRIGVAFTPDAFPRYTTHRRLQRDWDKLPEGKQQSLIALYDAELRGIDSHLERLLAWIEDTRGRDTVVIVTSDHGEELGEHGRVGHEYGLAQAIVHVPLMIRALTLPTDDVTAIVSIRRLYDFIESIAAGASPSLEPLMGHEPPGIISERYPSGHNAAYFGPTHARAWLSLIDGNLKAVGPTAHGFELFDLGTAGFDRPVAVTAPDARERMRVLVDEYWHEHRDPREEGPGLSDEQRERLRSLGYVR